MNLKSPCHVFMTNGELSRLAGWVPWEEKKWRIFRYSFFSLGQATRKVPGMPQWGSQVREELNKKARQGIAANRIPVPTAPSPLRGRIHLSSQDVMLLGQVLRALSLLGLTGTSLSNSCPGTRFTVGKEMD